MQLKEYRKKRHFGVTPEAALTPIPTAGGKVAEPANRALNDLAVGEEARVARVEDEDADFLRYLTSLRLLPGATVQLVRREPFGGPLEISGRIPHPPAWPVSGSVCS